MYVCIFCVPSYHTWYHLKPWQREWKRERSLLSSPQQMERADWVDREFWQQKSTLQLLTEVNLSVTLLFVFELSKISANFWQDDNVTSPCKSQNLRNSRDLYFRLKSCLDVTNLSTLIDDLLNRCGWIPHNSAPITPKFPTI